MNDLAGELIMLGGLLLLALFAEAAGRHTRLPRISMLILLGFLLGPAALGLIDPREAASFDFIAVLALSMVGFLFGGKLSIKLLRRVGKLILWLSLSEVLVTFLVLAVGLTLLGVPTELALLLGAIGTATDPAATLEAIRESKRQDTFTEVLTGIVAVDDAWGLIVFSLVVVALQIMAAAGAPGAIDAAFLAHALVELLGAILLGFLLGMPMALVSGRIRKGEPTLMEALGMVLVCAGLAQLLQLPHLLACVTLGATVVNAAKHHTRPFHAVEEIEWPFLALFFLFSGAYLTFDSLRSVGGVLLAYLVLRLLGRILGGWLGGLPRPVDASLARWMGVAMLPQAGVAMAMAFLASERYPQYAATLLPAVIAATVVFELLGPIMSRFALARAVQQRAGPADAAP
jgi:Kef-type K+ transport system membrane component KefB